MVESFGNRLAKDLFADNTSKELRGFPKILRRTARRKLLYLHEAVELKDLRAPPGNRLKELKGKWKGVYSIRINEQWRVVFQWNNGNAYKAQIIDYH